MTMCFVTVFCDSVLSSILFNRPGLLTEIFLFRSVMEFSLGGNIRLGACTRSVDSS